MNEIKENNYSVNILWKGNIACVVGTGYRFCFDDCG
jgi:hypothetical protein